MLPRYAVTHNGIPHYEGHLTECVDFLKERIAPDAKSTRIIDICNKKSWMILPAGWVRRAS